MGKMLYKKKSRGTAATASTVYFPAKKQPTLIERLREAIKKNYNY